MNPRETQTDRFTVDAAKVVHETIEGEAIVIQLESGFYYSLRGAGAQIWGLAASGRSVREIIEALEGSYTSEDGEIPRGVERLVRELRAEGLLEPASANGVPPGEAAAPSNGVPATPFEEPILSKYTDMQDFLLVDPIHETSEAGWPERQASA